MTIDTAQLTGPGGTLEGFAAANGLQYAENSPGPDYPSAIFHAGVDVTVQQHYRPLTGQFFDIGNLRYYVGVPGLDYHSQHRGFIAIHLPSALPHMFLDATGNNRFGRTGLPVEFDSGQVLELEGDFNDTFTLYAREGFEADALYIFTPDLMALVLDQTASFDVEIANDWMFVFSRERFDLADAQLMTRLLGIVEVVGAKARKQATNYRTERATRVSLPKHSAGAVTQRGGLRSNVRSNPRDYLQAGAFLLFVAALAVLFVAVVLRS